MKIAIFAFYLLLLLFSCKTNQYFETYPANLRKPSAIESKMVYKNVVYGSNLKEQDMDIYLPAGRDSINTPVVIIIHGGAWMMGDKSDIDQFGYDTFFNANGCAFINMNYRLDTTAPYPAQLDDIGSAIEYLKSKRGEWKINTNRICLFGGSAGGQLALSYAYTRNNDKSIKVVLDISGPSSFTVCYQEGILVNNITNLIGNYDSTAQLWHDYSPLYNLKSAVPTAIMHGTADSLVYFVQSVMLHDSLNYYNIPNHFIPLSGGGHTISTADWVEWNIPVLVWIKNYL
jgi:acetyl esterase/lipase